MTWSLEYPGVRTQLLEYSHDGTVTSTQDTSSWVVADRWALIGGDLARILVVPQKVVSELGLVVTDSIFWIGGTLRSDVL